MSATAVLIHLLGEIALLLWGINMISSGVQRAFGSDLRWILGIGLRTRMRAFLAGLGVTTVLQSSTATALMVSSFTAGGAVDLVPALAVMLGANVGTTLIVQVLSFDISLLFPALIFLGYFAYRRGSSSRLRDLGRVTIGLGLMLLSLHLLSETIRPIESSVVLKNLLASIAFDPIILVLLATIFAWAAHSSVAALLFIMSLATRGRHRRPFGARHGAGRQSRHRPQPARRRHGRRSGQAPGADRQPRHADDRLRRRAAAAQPHPDLSGDVRSDSGEARGEFPHASSTWCWRRFSSCRCRGSPRRS